MVRPARTREPRREVRLQSQIAHEALRQRLRSGVWSFGTELSTYGLAAELGMGRRPILEAMKRLEVEGFVRIIPRVGCQVVSPTIREVYDHFLISAALEGISAELAAHRATPESLARLREVWLSAESAVQAGDFHAYADRNRAFHAEVLAITGNDELARLIPPLWDLNDFYLLSTNKFREVMGRSHLEHGMIVAAIASGNPVTARLAMENHIRGMTREVETYFRLDGVMPAAGATKPRTD